MEFRRTDSVKNRRILLLVIIEITIDALNACERIISGMEATGALSGRGSHQKLQAFILQTLMLNLP